jgi:hypothetical protein
MKTQLQALRFHSIGLIPYSAGRGRLELLLHRLHAGNSAEVELSVAGTRRRPAPRMFSDGWPYRREANPESAQSSILSFFAESALPTLSGLPRLIRDLASCTLLKLGLKTMPVSLAKELPDPKEITE